MIPRHFSITRHPESSWSFSHRLHQLHLWDNSYQYTLVLRSLKCFNWPGHYPKEVGPIICIKFLQSMVMIWQMTKKRHRHKAISKAKRVFSFSKASLSSVRSACPNHQPNSPAISSSNPTPSYYELIAASYSIPHFGVHYFFSSQCMLCTSYQIIFSKFIIIFTWKGETILYYWKAWLYIDYKSYNY